MLKLKLLSTLVLLSFSNLIYAQATWDIRALANSTNASTRLVLANQSAYMEMPTSTAKALVNMTDRFSLLSGIYPKILIQQSNNLNAFATYREGQPVIVIDKPMFDLFVKDGGAAAAARHYKKDPKKVWGALERGWTIERALGLND